MTTGIFGGSFNPVHTGHIALAGELIRRGIVEEVWMTLSPVNPLKQNVSQKLLPDEERLHMLHLACDAVPGVEVCDIELRMPRPSYTINTLRTLAAEFPDRTFRLIVGSDNMLIFDRWKCHHEILRNFKPIVYPRPGYSCPQALDLPMNDISSTCIRHMIKEGRDISGLVPDAVRNYIAAEGLYR